jgi:Uma2 family endonuclease
MAATTLLTSEQFLAMPDQFDQSGNRIRQELIRGEVLIVPPPSQLHARININIIRALIAYIGANPQLGLQVFAEAPFVATGRDTLVPDASVVGKGRLRPMDEKYVTGGPDLAIEVVSPSETAQHLKSKVDAYLEGGSKSVWVVYPDAKSVEIYAGDSMREYKGDQKIEDPLLPDFSAPVLSFFDLT